MIEVLYSLNRQVGNKNLGNVNICNRDPWELKITGIMNH